MPPARSGLTSSPSCRKPRSSGRAASTVPSARTSWRPLLTFTRPSCASPEDAPPRVPTISARCSGRTQSARARSASASATTGATGPRSISASTSTCSWLKVSAPLPCRSSTTASPASLPDTSTSRPWKPRPTATDSTISLSRTPLTSSSSATAGPTRSGERSALPWDIPSLSTSSTWASETRTVVTNSGSVSTSSTRR